MVLEEKLLGRNHEELLALLDVLNSPIPGTIRSFLSESDSISPDVLEEFGQVREWMKEVRSIGSKPDADSLRFRIVASIMGMIPHRASEMAGNGGDSISLKYYSGNLAIGELESYLFFLFPTLTSEHAISQVIDGLNEVYDEYHEARNWIIDFSSISVLPKIFLGQLIAYRRLLRQKGRELYICWLKEGSISLSELGLLTEQAVLNCIGGMYFSEPVR